MRTKRLDAIVLRRTNYGEADRIVQFITPEGKISALARGVRRPKSKLAGGIELLAVNDVTYLEGKGALATVTSARANTFFRHIVQDYDRLQLAYYILKDVAQASEHLDDEAFFTITKTAFESLDTSMIGLDVTELYYRLHISELLGEAANLVRDSEGARLDATKRYRFDTMARAFIIDHNGVFTSDHIKLLRLASVQPPILLANVRAIESLVGDCLTVVRSLRT